MGYWERFAVRFRTQTRDGASYAYAYVSGLLRMEHQRTFANIGRTTEVAGQNLQHFMANSPWSAQAVIRQVQQEVMAKPGLAQGGVLILDETADEKAGEASAGASRQYNGRVGKVDQSQVGVFLAYANLTAAVACPTWLWVDGELFLPEHWFGEEMAPTRERLGIPSDRPFASKVELGWQMIERSVKGGLRFDWIACDDNYGKSSWFRAKLNQAGHRYMADVSSNTRVYLSKPTIGVPPSKPGTQGRPPTRERVISPEPAQPVSEVAARSDTPWQRVRVRAIERGEITDEFAVRRVWTTRDHAHGEPFSEEWLVIRRESSGRLNYSLSNAKPTCTIEELAWGKCQRYFVERANQDAKSELGWDEFQAQKYRAWEHAVALTILASWFIAETKLDWTRAFPRDPALAQEFDLAVLPTLSMANVRAMLRATLPLPQLTPQQAADLVVDHLVNRARARKSRLKHRQTHAPAP